MECAVFSADGRTVISCEGGQIKKGQFILRDDREGPTQHTIRFWDIETGKEWMRLKGHSGPILYLGLAPDGRHFITTGDDHTIRLWKMPEKVAAHQ